MATVTHSFIAAAPQERVWAYLSNFPLWRQFFILPQAKQKGWGTQFAMTGTASVGARLDMYAGSSLMQQWSIERWEPPRQFRIASRVWHDWFFKAMISHFEATLTPLAPDKTQVDIEFKTEFSTPLLGFLMNAFVPLHTTLRDVLAAMEKNLTSLLAAAP